MCPRAALMVIALPARDRLRGASFGIAAAVLFGISAPIAKLLLASIAPLMLAGLLYLGAGFGLSAIRLASRGRITEAPLRRQDLPALVGIIVTGGIIGPVLMLYGLSAVSGLTGSLLLNLEAPFTMLIAVMIFREHLSRWEVIAAMIIIAGALALSLEPGQLRGSIPGGLAIAAACASWGVDNNLTQRISLKDPIALVRIKTLGAGICTMLIALAAGQRPPAGWVLAAALVLGALSYGLSTLLDAYALRYLGAAREAAFFATAPFVGALIAIPLFDEPMNFRKVAAFALMATGVVMLVRARHAHSHRHDELSHEHSHIHDEHHRHEHVSTDPPGEPHSHPHRHEPISHEHPHVSDIHHRHTH